MSALSPFHLAIPVNHLKLSRSFYGEVLGCSEGRSSEHWVDFNFFGHQLVIHERPKGTLVEKKIFSDVDGHQVPIPHFGLVLEWEDWESLKLRLEKHQIDFVIEPYIRFEGENGEQATMFFLDPEGNALEFKSFKHLENLFAK